MLVVAYFLARIPLTTWTGAAAAPVAEDRSPVPA
jgi:hypothetical protein